MIRSGLYSLDSKILWAFQNNLFSSWTITADSSGFSLLFDGMYGMLHSWALVSVSLPHGVFSPWGVPKAELRKSSPGHSRCSPWCRHTVPLGVQHHVKSSSVPLARLYLRESPVLGVCVPPSAAGQGRAAHQINCQRWGVFSLARSSGLGLRLDLMAKNYSSTWLCGIVFKSLQFLFLSTYFSVHAVSLPEREKTPEAAPKFSL